MNMHMCILKIIVSNAVNRCNRDSFLQGLAIDFRELWLDAILLLEACRIEIWMS